MNEKRRRERGWRSGIRQKEAGRVRTKVEGIVLGRGGKTVVEAIKRRSL